MGLWSLYPILIKRIHYLHFFKFYGIEYLTINDNSSLHQFKSRRVFFSLNI